MVDVCVRARSRRGWDTRCAGPRDAELDACCACGRRGGACCSGAAGGARAITCMC
jgi:hypothetical protein